MIELYNNDCLEQMKQMEDNSVDSIITDPPYGLSFMGKKWDYDVPSEEIWKECLRVLKPGGTALIFAGSRTQHRMAVNIEDSGFILKDTIMWVYGSGFPKALDISKSIDNKYKAEREVVGTNPNHRTSDALYELGFQGGKSSGDITIASTDLAKDFNGWKSHSIKPAYEPILVCMKPNDGTYADNAEKWGVAGLNIDGARIEVIGKDDRSAGNRTSTFGTQETIPGGDGSGGYIPNKIGRFPANLIHDGSEEVLNMFPETKGGSGKYIHAGDFGKNGIYGKANGCITKSFTDNGSAARYFKQCNWDEEDVKRIIYNAKASKKEKGKDNKHPTVKPISLMKYLCELTKTPTGGIVLDPFMGSGSTGVAAINTGRDFIGIELNEEYFNICKARITKIP